MANVKISDITAAASVTTADLFEIEQGGVSRKGTIAQALAILPAANISGVISIANLATGTPNGTKFIRDDGTLVTPTSGGTPGGSSTQLQYNNSGVFAGISGATTDGTTLTLVAPILGAATATSINKVAFTAPATSATLTIADGKTATISNTLTFSGTDASTLNIGAGGTLGSNAYTSTSYAPLVSPSFTTPALGVANATTINKLTITAPATGSTLTIIDGKTLTANNSLIFSGTDGSTLNIGTGGTLGSNAYTSTAYVAASAVPGLISQVITTAIAATWTITTGGAIPITSVNPSSGSSLTAVSLVYSDLIDGGKLKFKYLKTTASDLVLTFPSGTVINDQNGNEVVGLASTMTSSTSGQFQIEVDRFGSVYYASIIRKVA